MSQIKQKSEENLVDNFFVVDYCDPKNYGSIEKVYQMELKYKSCRMYPLDQVLDKEIEINEIRVPFTY